MFLISSYGAPLAQKLMLFRSLATRAHKSTVFSHLNLVLTGLPGYQTLLFPVQNGRIPSV